MLTCLITRNLSRHSAAPLGALVSRHLSAAASQPLVLYERRGQNKQVGLITIDRKKELNALSKQVFSELDRIVYAAEEDDTVEALVLTGFMKAFAAGADIKEMKDNTFSENFRKDFSSDWLRVANCRKPIIAAVNGYALGGGCELAMMCDILYAGDNAKFGQPEINIGIIPGMGGTQRLIRAIGKSRAMEMCLTGEFIDAQQAAAWGLVSKVFPADQTVDEAIKLGEKISTKSMLAVSICKEAVLNSQEMTLTQGLRSERRLFQTTFATNDQKEGMTAFLEKRAPKFTNT